MSETVKKIKDLTKSLTEDASQLAKQAEAGFKSQWMGVNDRGEAEWGKSPGIYYGTVGLPALADIAKEGVAPEWAKEADEKAAKIREAVERKMRIEEPKGFPQQLARAAGEMVAQVPVPGAILNKLRTAKLAVNQSPSIARKIALAPVEYFSPIVEVGKAKPTAINYGVGTLFGGGLGYGIEKLTEEKPSLRGMLDKYGPNYGSEVRDVSKPQKFAGGGKATKLKQGRSAFFSAVDRAISTLRQEKGTPEQMFSLIEKTPGVKKEELERRKIKQKLQGRKSVTKAELETIAKENPAQAPNITRLKPKPALEDAMERLKEDTGLDDLAIQNIETKLGMKFTLRPSGLALDDGRQSHDLSDLVEQVKAGDIDLSAFSKTEAQDLLNDIKKIQPYYNRRLESKYGQYSLIGQGGERKDYQEVIMSMPTRSQQLREFAEQRGITNIEEAEKAWVAEHGQLLPEDETIGHWKDIPVKNYTVHYRTQSFVDKDGKKVLHVEEIQSDPHQRARDARKDEIKKRMENEKDRRFRKLAQQLDEDEDFLPEGFEFYSINESGEMGGETGLGIFNTRTGVDLGGMEGFDDDEIVEMLKKKFKSTLRQALKDQVSLSDDEIKAFAKEVPDDFGYMSAEKQAKVDEINKKITRIRDQGLSADELEDYFKPGNIIKSWSGTDKVLDFTRGPKRLSPAWLRAYDAALEHMQSSSTYRNNYSEQELKSMAENIANSQGEDWHVKVVEIDPQTGKEIGSPRIHSTNPSSEVIRQLHSEAADLGGVISDLPYKKTYDELALKQIINDAVNQGYDRVSISPGLFQVDRYQSAIRSRIDGIEWGPMTDDGRTVSFMKNGRSISDVTIDTKGKVKYGPGEWKDEPLKNIIGEDMASKIIASPERGEFSGEGLTIGAKGFVEFYDKRLPNFLREYLRKEFGADTGRTEFEYGRGDRQKSRYTIEQDIYGRRASDSLTEQEVNDLESHTMDEWFEAYNIRARSNGLDPEDPDVEMQAFNDEGIFDGLRDQSENRAISKYIDQIYKAQPEVRPKADVFSFDVTPEMSEKVKTQGQRLFAAAPIVALPMAEDDEDKRKVSPSYTIAPEAKTPTLTQDEEQQFQSDVRGTDWFSRFKEKFGEEPNLEDKEYNYRAAWKSGARPQAIEQDDIPHWPSVSSSGESLKARSHPSGWMEDYSQITGRDPSEGGDLTPEQTDAMNKSLMYRYGFAGGGRANKMKLTPQEQKIVDYHRNTIKGKAVGMDQRGRPVTVYTTTIPTGRGDEHANVPGYVGGKIRDREELQRLFKDEISQGRWPVYKTGREAGRRAAEVHSVMDDEVGAAEESLKQIKNPNRVVTKEFAKGGTADKMKQVLKKMGADESKIANKDLTTLQDFHTSLSDSIRERAAKMQQQMNEMKFKYSPGQHVFTESTARKNLPPLKILGKTMVGNQPVREPHPDHPLMGKVVKDPETGKTLRTPYEPGYKVRHERGEDDWAEYDIPESAIKGSIDEFAKGGTAKKIRELRQKMANETGEYNAKRLDRAADEVKNLVETYDVDALRRAFMGDNTTGLVIVDPGKYEKFAAKLPRKGYDEDVHGASPQYRIGDQLVNYDEYIKHLQSIAQKTGFSDVPYLNINKNDKDALLYISGHEGRHRQRALSDLGDTKSLVRIEPRAAIREPIERRTKEQGIGGLKAAIQNKPVRSENDEIIILPEVFRRGGKV